MELFSAGDVNWPTVFLSASVAAGFNRYPQATHNKWFYPEYGPLILVKTQIICV